MKLQKGYNKSNKITEAFYHKISSNIEIGYKEEHHD
jgi:hypothetical protein